MNRLKMKAIEIVNHTESFGASCNAYEEIRDPKLIIEIKEIIKLRNGGKQLHIDQTIERANKEETRRNRLLKELEN